MNLMETYQQIEEACTDLQKLLSSRLQTLESVSFPLVSDVRWQFYRDNFALHENYRKLWTSFLATQMQAPTALCEAVLRVSGMETRIECAALGVQECKDYLVALAAVHDAVQAALLS